MEKEKVILKAPPRLLLGVSFLFWGAMVESPIIGFICAVLVEARHWTSLRWRFGELGFARAWQLCILILIVTVVVKFGSEEDRMESSLGVLSMLPMIFLPLVFAQQYCSDRGIPLTTFSFVARRKIALDRKAGRTVTLSPCQMGYPYLGLLLASAGLGVDDTIRYGIGVVAIMGWSLMHLSDGKRRPWAWSIAFVLSIGIAVGTVHGVFYAYGKIYKAIQGRSLGDSRQVQTAMGQVQELKLSSDIDWRYVQKEGSRPLRLRMATYNVFSRDRWIFRMSSKVTKEIPEERDAGGNQEFLFSSGEETRSDFAYLEEDLTTKGNGRALLRGQVDDGALIPIPVGSRRFVKVPTEGMVVNQVGATHMYGPDNGTLLLEIVSDIGRVAEEDPVERDVEVPVDELGGVGWFLYKELSVSKLPNWEAPVNIEKKGRDSKKRLTRMKKRLVVEDLEVDEGWQLEVLQTIKQSFASDFEYSLDLTPEKGAPVVSDFLKTMKKGHCEYFASAGTLLSRRAGIPTRYVVGYVLDEKGDEDGEWVMRGKHAHAWCQAYVGGTWRLEPSANGLGKDAWRCRGGTWMDVDFTPGVWRGHDVVDQGWKQKLHDWWQLLIEDVSLWFSGPVVSRVVEVILWMLGIGLVIWIIWRLWTTKTKDGKVENGSWYERCLDGYPLIGLEKWLAKKVGPRPVGTPVAEWLENSYPEESRDLLEKYRALRFDPNASEMDFKREIAELKKRVRNAL